MNAPLCSGILIIHELYLCNLCSTIYIWWLYNICLWYFHPHPGEWSAISLWVVFFEHWGKWCNLFGLITNYKVGCLPVISRVVTPFIGLITPVIHLFFGHFSGPHVPPIITSLRLSLCCILEPWSQGTNGLYHSLRFPTALCRSLRWGCSERCAFLTKKTGLICVFSWLEKHGPKDDLEYIKKSMGI